MIKNILLKPFNNRIFYGNNIFKIDNGNNIFFGLKNDLKKFNIDINTIDVGTRNKVDYYIYCDLPYPWEMSNWLGILKHRAKNILLVFESPLINPFNHFHFLYRLFFKVYTWDTSAPKDRRVRDFRIPQIISSNLHFNKKKVREYVSIFSKKSTFKLLKVLSKYKSDLYKKRLDLIRYFEIQNKNEFDLYGYGWNKNVDSIINYKGVIGKNEKLNTLSRYKFSFVYENCSAPGYISEKIFDCFSSGCVPIYLGAPDSSNFIPSNAYIDFRTFDSITDIIKYIDKLSKVDYNNYLNSGGKFIKSSETKCIWSRDGFIKRLINEIVK